MAESYQNLVEMQEASCAKFRDKPLYGVKKGSTYEWVSFAQLAERVDAFRAGLASLGVTQGDVVAVISKNTVEWAVAAYATYGLGALYIPMYESQLDEEWHYILKDCGAKVVLAADERIYNVIAGFVSKLETLEHVVLLRGTLEEGHTYDSLVATGKASPIESVKPDSDAPFGMIYTSGTTGHPKGVVLSHKNMLRTMERGTKALEVGPGDRSVAFLPWAHIFGQVAEVHGLVYTGASAGLIEDVTTLVDELSIVRPTLFFAVPRVYNRIYDRLNAQLKEKPAIYKLFQKGLRLAKAKREGQSLGFLDKLTLALVDRVVFEKIRQRFGGRLKAAMSGASALSTEVQEFINDVGIPIYEGYGLSETTAIVSMNNPVDRKFGTVGKVMDGVRVVLDKTVAASNSEDGEIIVYGDGIMTGYHNQPDKTRAVIADDGGFRTGDLGRLDSDGFLMITGRVKEQYKLENGKYVAPAPLEETLKLSPYIEQCMIFGSNKVYNVALVVVAQEELAKYAQREGISASGSDLLEHASIQDLFNQEIQAQSTKFKGFEKPRNFKLLSEEWTVENGLLTPTMKLKRTIVEKLFAEDLESLYND